MKAEAKKVVLDFCDESKTTSVMLCAQSNRVEGIRLLLEAGSSIDLKDSAQESVIFRLFNLGRRMNFEILKILDGFGPNYRLRNGDRDTCLLKAFRLKKLEAASFLIPKDKSILFWKNASHISAIDWIFALQRSSQLMILKNLLSKKSFKKQKYFYTKEKIQNLREKIKKLYIAYFDFDFDSFGERKTAKPISEGILFSCSNISEEDTSFLAFKRMEKPQFFTSHVNDPGSRKNSLLREIEELEQKQKFLREKNKILKKKLKKTKKTNLKKIGTASAHQNTKVNSSIENNSQNNLIEMKSNLNGEICRYIDGISVFQRETLPLVKKISRIIKKKTRDFFRNDISIALAGSLVTGLNMPWSDLNFIVNFETHRRKSQISRRIYQFTKLIGKSKIVQSSKLEERSSLMILKLKLVQNLGSKRVEIIFKYFSKDKSKKKEEIILDFLACYPLSRPLYILLRKLLHNQGLDDPSSSGLKTICIFYLIIAFLQQA